MSRIVVGIDGSEESRKALRWALDEARLRNAPLRVVHVWMLPYIATGPGLDPTLDTGVIETARRNAEELVANELGGAGVDLSGLDVERAIVSGSAAPTLIEASEGADLLVVGSRGRGGFKELLLGSVSQQCAHHASCPVVIVPRSR